jgi:hypothetical protein
VPGVTPSSGRSGRAEPAAPQRRPEQAGSASQHASPEHQRRCTRNGCRQPAIATLTYIYAASTAVVGPLAVAAEPHTYDLCAGHARTLTAPRGWELVRHDGELAPPTRPDDLAALAEAVWADRPERAGRRTAQPPRPRGGRGSHLRVVPPS